MSARAVMRPLAGVLSVVNVANPQQLDSADPKQVATAGAGDFAIQVDLGSATAIDSVFVGHTTAAAGEGLVIHSGLVSGYENLIGQYDPLQSSLYAGRRHYWASFPVVTARYITIHAQLAAPIHIGVVAVGKGWRPERGAEWGGGAGLVDTGTATRRRDGGFGIDPGVRAITLQWTFGDLSDAEVEGLFAVLHDLGETGTALVIEGDDAGPTRSEQLHWGRFARIESYERQDRGTTRWSLRFEDWA